MEQPQYITLSQGKTRYHDVGPREGKPVVLLHGMAMSLFVWERLVPALVDEGYRVIRYDLLGRGLSDKPAIDYTPEVFEKQLLDVLAHLEMKQPISLFGTSMGGAVVTHFTHQHPDRVERLGLIAPAGMPFPIPWIVKLGQSPAISSIFMKLLGDTILHRSVSKSFVNPKEYPEFREEFAKQLEDPGFHGAVLSSIRHMPLHGMEDTYRVVGQLNLPTFLAWGQQDQIVPYSTHKKVLDAIPHATFVSVENAGHIPHYETPDAVLPQLLNFLRS